MQVKTCVPKLLSGDLNYPILTTLFRLGLDWFESFREVDTI